MAVCLLDFETTGLYPELDEIIEIGLKIVNENIVYNKLIKPNLFINNYVNKKITEITGITHDMLEKNGIKQSDACMDIFIYL